LHRAVQVNRSYRFLGRLIGNRCASPIFALLLLTSASAVAEILPADCARAAKYSESKRGVSMLVLQNGQTIFEHYANGGSARGRWPIFSGTKSFWGVAALAAMRDGLFKLDDPVSDTITEWKSDPRKSQITSGSYSARPMVSKARRGCSARRSEIASDGDPIARGC
jgi:Beta-lactamase class C and other penicillin binding proteins